MGTFLSIGYTFMRQSFNFQKTTGTLKIKTFFWKFAEFRFFLGIIDIFCDLVRPCANWKKQTNKCKILDLGSQNSLLQHDIMTCAQHSFQKSLHPTVQVHEVSLRKMLEIIKI